MIDDFKKEWREQSSLREFLQGNQFDEIEDFLKQSIQEAPKNELAHYYLGLIYYKQKKYLESIKSFENALQINPQDGDAWYYLHRAFKKRGFLDESKNALSRAIKLNSTEYYSNVQYVNEIGIILRSLPLGTWFTTTDIVKEIWRKFKVHCHPYFVSLLLTEGIRHELVMHNEGSNIWFCLIQQVQETKFRIDNREVGLEEYFESFEYKDPLDYITDKYDIFEKYGPELVNWRPIQDELDIEDEFEITDILYLYIEKYRKINETHSHRLFDLMTKMPSGQVVSCDERWGGILFERIQNAENGISELVGRNLEIIQTLLSGCSKEYNILKNIYSDPCFMEYHRRNQEEFCEKVLHTRHDQYHVLTTMTFAIELVGLLWRQYKELFELNSMKPAEVFLAVGLAALWHDCGIADSAKKGSKSNHEIISWKLAEPFVKRTLTKYYYNVESLPLIQRLFQKNNKIKPILKVIRDAILHHPGGGRDCPNMESAIVRIADGLDCSVFRVGSSGLKANCNELFMALQATHIGGKVPITYVFLEPEKNSSKIFINIEIDPLYLPKNGELMTSLLMHELQILQKKITSSGTRYANLFDVVICDRTTQTKPFSEIFKPNTET